MAEIRKSENMPFQFNGVHVKTPNTFTPNMATTSTGDSDRTQDLVMHNTPIGTIESYSMGWNNIEPEEVAKIIAQIKNKSHYSLRHLNFETGKWETRMFYTSNYTGGTLKQVNGKDAWESLSFDAICIYPV